jgi:hypothetical protein
VAISVDRGYSLFVQVIFSCRTISTVAAIADNFRRTRVKVVFNLVKYLIESNYKNFDGNEQVAVSFP